MRGLDFKLAFFIVKMNGDMKRFSCVSSSKFGKIDVRKWRDACHGKRLYWFLYEKGR